MTMPLKTWSVVSAIVLGIVLMALLLLSRKYKNLPPGPKGLPFIGSLHLLGKFPQKDLTKLAETFGPLMSIWLGSQLVVVATSPAAAKEVLKLQGPNFSGRPKTSMSDNVLPGDVAMASDSPVRLHMKKVIHMHLSTNKQLQLNTKIRVEEIAHVMSVIPLDGTTLIHVRKHVEVIVTNIISRMVLKKRYMATTSGTQETPDELEQVNQFRYILSDIVKTGQMINLGDFVPIIKLLDIFGIERKMQKLREKMDAFMSEIISEHMEQRKSGSPCVKDIVDVLLDQKEGETLPFKITNANVTSTLWNSFVGGIDTSTDTIEWAIAECIRKPMVMKKAQEELDTIVGKSRRVEEGDVPNLLYLQAIVKETFRLHPVLSLLIPHVNQEACKVLGYDIPKKTPIFVNIAAIAQDAMLWEDPLTFKPERFLEGMPCANVRFDGTNSEMLPFGAGRRQCPGILLASTMVHIVVATFLQSFDWSLSNDLESMDLDMSQVPGVGHALAHPLMAIPKPRLLIL